MAWQSPRGAGVTPRDGQTLTLTLRSAEPLSGAPKVTLSQPGRSAVVKLARAVGDQRYQVTFTLPVGVTGPATVSIAARDAAGHAVSQRLAVNVQ
jgi:hypothetical protein